MGMHISDLPDADRGMPRWGVAPVTASGSGAVQQPRRPWYNLRPDNGIRQRARMRTMFPEAAATLRRADIDEAAQWVKVGWSHPLAKLTLRRLAPDRQRS